MLQYRAAARGDEPALLLDGPHLVQEALAAGLAFSSALVIDSERERRDVSRLAGLLQARGVRVTLATADVMAAVSPVRSPSPIVALAEPRAISRDAPYQVDRPLVLVACHVQDPGNLGAMVRVAEAAGASGLIAAGASADPFGWKAVRGSMGSALRLSVVRENNAAHVQATAREQGCRVIATVPRGGTPLFQADLRGPVAIFLGGEGQGLDDALARAADLRLTIPMEPPVESLNAAVAAALIAYECRRQRQGPVA